MLTELLLSLWLCLPMFINTCQCCFSCLNCATGTARRRLQLEVGGVADDGCTDCDEDPNAVFVLEYNEELTGVFGACTWASEQFVNGLCGGPGDHSVTQSDRWFVTTTALNYALVLKSRDASTIATLRTPDHGGVPASCAFDPDDPAFDFTHYIDDGLPGTGCDLSAVVVAVSALDG